MLLLHLCCCCGIRPLYSIISYVCRAMAFHVGQEECHSSLKVKKYTLLLILQKCFSRCTSNGQCVDINKVCDFRTDCSDKSDEANCPPTCNFENGYCKWTNAQVGDHYDWIRNKGKTPSKFTGPSTDHTYNTSAGLSHSITFFYAS